MPQELRPFPFEAVRDLLGIVRAMYASAKEQGAAPNQLRRVARIGEKLAQSLLLAAEARAGTVGHTSAWRQAESATRSVGEMVDALTPAEPLVTAARARVTGARVALRKKAIER
jgi:hypothetical protein